ncbi:MAG: histidine kinase, partial [Saprospiraceae bacterium]|nr:histidine kinase [Saprospiraceae bacterium]
VTSIELFQNLEIWIGTQNQGIWRATFDDMRAHPIYNMSELNNSKITDVAKDMEGDIWFCDGSSVAYSANRQFEWALSKVANIQAVYEDRNKVVWVGTDSSLYKFQHLPDGKEQWTPFWKRRIINITSLYEDSVGKLWVGTYGEGLFCISSDRKKVFHFTTKNSKLPDGNIFSITEQNGKIWLATLRGVVVIKNPEFVGYEKLKIDWYNKENGLPTDYIYTVFIDSRGVAWLGTDSKGLVKILNGEISYFQSTNDIPFKSVYSITEDNLGNIWFCSSDNGIFKYNGEKFTQLALPEGLRNLTITGLTNDSKGNILVVHPFGIDLLNPELEHLIYYDQEIGAEDIEPNLNTVSHGSDKKIWIGTNKGLITYTALEEDLQIHPRTLIKSVSVFLEKEEPEASKTFGYEENHLSFDCIGLWYTDPKTVEYRYILDGYDLDWKKSRDNFISYPHLPPGDYTLKIQSTENSAFDKEPITEYQFTIGKPYWQQLWFILSCIALAGGGFYWYQRMRDSRIHREAEMKKEKIESQFEALKSQINPHFLFNSFNTLMTVIDENPGKAMDYVQALSDFYRSIVQYREKEIIPMTEELEIVENYGYLLSQRYGDNLEIEFDIKDTNGFLVPLSLQMLVENAVKHNVISKSKPLRISIQQENGFIVVSNPLQLKLTPEPSTQYGLDSIAKRYVYLTSKKMLLEKTETHFIVRLPIIPAN